MKIFGVSIDNLPRSTVQKYIEAWFVSDTFHRIATVNPEFLLRAERNVHFKQSLIKADLRIADGFGIHFPFWLSGEELIGRYPGTDLVWDMLKLAEDKEYPVGLVLHEHGLSTPLQILAALKERYPKLQVALYTDTSRMNFQPMILLCNYGAPLQETYLESLRGQNTGIKIAMGVGGAFDFLTGVVSRAPRWMRGMGLEWLWRLYQQPKRFRRVWNAVVAFPIKVLSQK